MRSSRRHLVQRSKGNANIGLSVLSALYALPVVSIPAPGMENNNKNPPHRTQPFRCNCRKRNIFHAERYKVDMDVTAINLTDKYCAVQLSVDVQWHPLCDSASIDSEGYAEFLVTKEAISPSWRAMALKSLRYRHPRNIDEVENISQGARSEQRGTLFHCCSIRMPTSSNSGCSLQ